MTSLSPLQLLPIFLSLPTPDGAPSLLLTANIRTSRESPSTGFVLPKLWPYFVNLWLPGACVEVALAMTLLLKLYGRSMQTQFSKDAFIHTHM